MIHATHKQIFWQRKVPKTIWRDRHHFRQLVNLWNQQQQQKTKNVNIFKKNCIIDDYQPTTQLFQYLKDTTNI